jgi:hypothetical protein
VWLAKVLLPSRDSTRASSSSGARASLAEVIARAHQGIERLRQTQHLAYSFLRHAGLSAS